MSRRDEGDVGRRDFLKLVGVAGAAAGTLPLRGSGSADETIEVTAEVTHTHPPPQPAPVPGAPATNSSMSTNPPS